MPELPTRAELGEWKILCDYGHDSPFEGRLQVALAKAIAAARQTIELREKLERIGDILDDAYLSAQVKTGDERVCLMLTLAEARALMAELDLGKDGV